MKADKLLLICLAAVVIVKFIAGFPLDNSTIPGGTDVAHFFTNSWYIATHGLTKWNYFWYAGFPFLRYYPPLSFLITGFLARLVGIFSAYKFVNDLFLTLTPLAFYLFLREFKLSREKEIVALIIFSFIPIFAYFLVDGRFTTIVNVFFALLYWKFLKRSLDTKGFYNISAAALLLGLSLLTHHTTTFLFIIISSAWALIYKTSFETIKKLVAIFILTLALTAWWSLPFFIETVNTSKSGLYLRVVGGIYVGDVIYRIRTSVLQSQYYITSFEPYIIVSLAAFMAVISLMALTRYRDKTTRDFILLLIFIVIMVFFVRYERSVVFAAVPFSFIAAEGLGLLKKKLRMVATASFILLLAASYLLIRPQIFEVPNYPDIPKDGRIIFFPIGGEYRTGELEMKNFYSVILSPMNDQENIRGWHDESQLIGNSAPEKISYLNNVSNPINTSKDDYYKLLSAGYINYVAVNKNDTEMLNYFKSSDPNSNSNSTSTSKFKEIFSDGMFAVYEINPKATYVEFNGAPAANTGVDNVKKMNDEIEIDTNCQKGTVVIKESYHQMWQASINGRQQKVSFDDYGMIQLDSNFEGNCKIILKFQDPQYYLIFYLISAIAIVFILFNILKKF